MTLPTINSFTNWGRLHEVWLGDVYPSHFYDHLPGEVRDVFYEITEKTQHDLAIIQRKMEEFDIVVRRPHYNSIDDYLLHDSEILSKPQITPRDYHLVYGNTLLFDRGQSQCWEEILQQYAQDQQCKVIEAPNLQYLGGVTGANTVRTGRDLYLDILNTSHTKNRKQCFWEFKTVVQPLFPDARLHLLTNGGHVDACFAVPKPGLLLTSKYFNDYARTFPSWQHINITKPEFAKHSRKMVYPHGNQKFWNTAGSVNRAFNDHVLKHAQDWVGNYTETYFEVNCLVVDEHNVLMLGENDAVFRELEQHGITAHSLPFRTRTFWDGGLHCLTLDIRRQDSKVDLFPDRTQSIYFYD